MYDNNADDIIPYELTIQVEKYKDINETTIENNQDMELEEITSIKVSQEEDELEEIIPLPEDQTEISKIEPYELHEVLEEIEELIYKKEKEAK